MFTSAYKQRRVMTIYGLKLSKVVLKQLIPSMYCIIIHTFEKMERLKHCEFGWSISSH